MMFKVNFEREKYIDALPNYLVKAYCKFRTSNHRLKVETLRHVIPRIPRIERKCDLCNLNETANEYHHIFYCTKFSDIRRQFIPVKYLRRSNFTSFIDIMSSKNEKTMKNVAIYLSRTMKQL